VAYNVDSYAVYVQSLVACRAAVKLRSTHRRRAGMLLSHCRPVLRQCTGRLRCFRRPFKVSLRCLRQHPTVVQTAGGNCRPELAPLPS